MANSKQMAVAVAALLGEEVTTVETISRVLQENQLRTPGGRGRGAAAMTALDIFHVTLTLAAGVGMREAPDFVRKVSSLPLSTGDVEYGPGGRVEFSSYSETSAVSMLAWKRKSNPLKDMDIGQSFGNVMASWIDGQFDEVTAWKETGSVRLEISNVGPAARFCFEEDPLVVDLRFGHRRKPTEALPAVERLTIIRGQIFKEMSRIFQIEGGKRNGGEV